MILTADEIKGRINRFIETMNAECPDWDTSLIVDNVNQYYFTGTMQDGILVIKRGGSIGYFVRKSYERAVEQALIGRDNVYEMSSYKDIAKVLGAELGCVYLEQEIMPLAMLSRLKKYLNIGAVIGVDNVVKNLRSVKSAYELSKIAEAGRLQSIVMSDIIPSLLKEGMSEADFAAEVIYAMLKNGHHGVSRFTAFQTEIAGGQFAFGDGALVTSSFNGPAGMRPYSPAVPAFASRERKLKKGDLVFADLSFGVEGYHCDKTRLYIFKGKPSDEVKAAHSECLKIQKSIAQKLVPGEIPSKVYSDTLSSLDAGFKTGFMGKSEVKFLGHGVGLVVDEFPVIAKGFDAPLKENMTIAVEPKKVCAEGLVGVEDTFVVKVGGAISLSGESAEIIEV